MVPDAAKTARYHRFALGLAVLSVGFFLWLLNNPYQGLRHDARIYAAMALRWLEPEAYARDLLFQYGAQDNFTVFAPYYATLIRIFGIDHGSQAGTLLAALAWVAAARWAMSRLLGEQAGLLAFLVLCTVPMTYCLGMPIFYVSENFVSPRLYAEALVLTSIAAMLLQRWKLALSLNGLAVLLHPLMGIWGWVILLASRLSDRQLLLSLAGSIVLVGLMVWNPLDLERLRPMGAEWRDIVSVTSGAVFLDPWPGVRINDSFWWFAALLFGFRFGTVLLRRTYALICLVAATGLLVSLFASYCWPIALVMQVQPWRALWLAVVFALVAIIDLAVRAWPNPNARIGVGYLLLAWMLNEWGGGMAALAVALLWPYLGAISVRWRERWCERETLLRRYGWMLAAGIVAEAVPGFIVSLGIMGSLRIDIQQDEVGDVWRGLVLVSWMFVVPLCFWAMLNSSRWRRASLLLLLPLSAYAVASWDQRTPLQHEMEVRYGLDGRPRLFGDYIRRGHVVLWPAESLRVWYEIGTANYASSEQGIGIVFSERRTMELHRRLERVAIMDAEYDAAGNIAPDSALVAKYYAESRLPYPKKLILYALEHDVSYLSRAGLVRFCSDPELDFVVSYYRHGDWAVVAHEENLGKRHHTLYLYDCRQIPTDGRLPADSATGKVTAGR